MTQTNHPSYIARTVAHPLVGRVVDDLVAHAGGVVIYDFGCGGREAALTAAIMIAQASRTPLIVIDAAVMRTQIAEHIDAVAPDLPWEFVTPQLLVRHGGVPIRPGCTLAVHADRIAATGRSGRFLHERLPTVAHLVAAVHARDVQKHADLIAAASDQCVCVLDRATVLADLPN